MLLDPARGADGEAPLTRLTPEVAFPESEGWPQTYFAAPYPLSEDHYLVAWSHQPLPPGTPRPLWGMAGPPNDLGLYLFDAFGNLNLIYRDPEISSDDAAADPAAADAAPDARRRVDWADRRRAGMLLVDVYRRAGAIVRAASIRQLRLVGVPAKTHPTMNHPSLGVTRDDPGKFVIGTVPVEADGSAYFRVPAGVTFFLQALDAQGHGRADDAQRHLRAARPDRHLHRLPRTAQHLAAQCRPLPRLRREPSKITPGPDGSWPLDYQVLVQPVLDAHCVACHRAGHRGSRFDLTAASPTTRWWTTAVRHSRTTCGSAIKRGGRSPGRVPPRPIRCGRC